VALPGAAWSAADAVSASTVKLLRAASEIAGGDRALAEHLGIGETLLAKFMDDSVELPDRLLLRAVDIILADREPLLRPLGGEATA
jgi:hypothetical protein